MSRPKVLGDLGDLGVLGVDERPSNRPKPYNLRGSGDQGIRGFGGLGIWAILVISLRFISQIAQIPRGFGWLIQTPKMTDMAA